MTLTFGGSKRPGSPSALHGKNVEGGDKFRIVMDDAKEKVRLFRKEASELVPLAVWSYDRLINEMRAHDD